LEKSHPVDREYESEKNERDGIFSLGDSQALFGEPKQEGKGDAGKEHPSQDDDDGRKGDPFSEETGQSEQKDRNMDLSEASLLIRFQNIFFELGKNCDNISFKEGIKFPDLISNTCRK
jgi:hypothetical protein